MTPDDRSGNPPPGEDNRPPGSDPSYQGAKPAAAGAGDLGWGFFGESAFVPNDAMSAMLARNWWAIALRGVFAILFGVIALLLPGVTLAALVLLFGAYMVVDGVFALVAGIRAARHHERWGALILEGIADLVAAAIAFFWPLATILAFVYLMGAWAIVSGVLLMSAVFRLNIVHGRWLMGIGAAVSIIWGVLLLTWPFTGAVVLTWWMGAYALFFGVALIALAFRLHRLHGEIGAAGGVAHGI